MGTRAVTNVVDEEGVTWVSLYRQYDGYPDGHGQELADWLDGAVIGNGISGGERRHFFNGVGDLACRLVTFFKQDHTSPGSFYLQPPREDDGDSWVDYTYTVRCDSGYDQEGSVIVDVKGYNEHLFSGTIEEMHVWIKRYNEDDE